MKYLYESGRISKHSCVATLPDGECVVGWGKEEVRYFPMDNIGKYEDLWATWTKEAESARDEFNLKHNRSNTDIRIQPMLDFKVSKQVGVYKANLKLDGFGKGGQANDKVYWIDADTGAHYSMDISDMYEMVNGFAQGIVSANGGVITAEVFPNVRGGTTFLSVFTKEMKEEIEHNNSIALKRKTEKLKPKQFVVGNVYNTNIEWGDNSYNKVIYLGKWEIKHIRKSYWGNDNNETETWNIFVTHNVSEYDGITTHYYWTQCRKGMISAYKDLGKYEGNMMELVNAVNIKNGTHSLVTLI